MTVENHTTHADDGYDRSDNASLNDAYRVGYHAGVEDKQTAAWWTGWCWGLVLGTLCGVTLALVLGGRL